MGPHSGYRSFVDTQALCLLHSIECASQDYALVLELPEDNLSLLATRNTVREKRKENSTVLRINTACAPVYLPSNDFK